MSNLQRQFPNKRFQIVKGDDGNDKVEVVLDW